MSSAWLSVLLIILMLGMWITTDAGFKGFALAIAAFLAHMWAGVHAGIVDLTPRSRGLVAAHRSDFVVEHARQDRLAADSDQAAIRKREVID